MNLKLTGLALLITVTALLSSCSTGKIILSKNANLSQYKYVMFGNKTSGNGQLDDIIMEVENQIAETDLKIISVSDRYNYELADSILTPDISVTSEKWDGGKTYITVTFKNIVDNRSVVVVKSSGIGMTVGHDQSIAVKAMKKKLNQLFKKNQ